MEIDNGNASPTGDSSAGAAKKAAITNIRTETARSHIEIVRLDNNEHL